MAGKGHLSGYQKISTEKLCEFINFLQHGNPEHVPVTPERLDSTYLWLEQRHKGELDFYGVAYSKVLLHS